MSTREEKMVQTPTGPLDVAMVRHMVDRLRTRNSPVCANIIEALLDTVLTAKAQPGESSAEVESAPTLPGDPRALELALSETDDEKITCLFCKRDGCELEFGYRDPQSARAYLGVHRKCLPKLGMIRAPTASGDPRALELADRCDPLAKREEWNECEDAIECALTEAATILRRAPKREDVPGDPEAAELAEWLEWCADVSTKAFAERALKASAILRRAPRADIDALEKAMREGAQLVLSLLLLNDSRRERAHDRLEAAIAKMRREAGGGDK